MIATRFIVHRMSLIFNFELKRSRKIFTVSKLSSDKCIFYQSFKKISSHSRRHVTLLGVGVDNKFLTINNNLSRAMSDGSKEKFIVNYNDVVKAQGNNNILIIDVRENNEIQDTGKLPDSIHIPMNDITKALNLSNEDFEKKYNKKKPKLIDKIIVSCRSGRRSVVVQDTMKKLGYSNTYNYEGGWLDWESHQKK